MSHYIILRSVNQVLQYDVKTHRFEANTTAARENVATHICQQCGSNPAAACDVSVHTRHVLRNRDTMTTCFAGR